MHIAFLARKTLFSQPGGDTVQVEQTAAALARLGHSSNVVLAGQPLPDNVDILHGFNLGRPADLLPYFSIFPGKKVLSSIYVDYSLADAQRFPTLFKFLGKHGLEYIKTVGRALNGSDRWPSMRYLISGQKRSATRLIAATDVVITSSQSEAERIQADFGVIKNHKTIPLGIGDEFLATPPDTERQGILVLGRLEWLKNQKTVIEWARKENWPMTVMGDANTNQPKYYEQCRAIAGPSTTFLPYATGDALLHELQCHKLLLIPSHFESFSLVGWEAAAQGMQVIFNDVADMKETLAPVGTALDFSNAQTAIQTIQSALDETSVQKKSQAPLESRSWDQIVKQILQAYA